MEPPAHSAYRRAFLSHAYADNELCARLAAALRARGVDCWLDLDNAQMGHTLSEDIERQLEGRSAFLLMVTSASNNSHRVALELGNFIALWANKPTHLLDGKERLILPVRLEDVPIPLRARTFNWIDAVGQPFEQVVDRITRALLIQPLSTPASADYERARGITFPTPGPDGWAVGAAADAEPPPETFSQAGPPQPPAPAPGAPPILNEPSVSAPTTGALPPMAGTASSVISPIEFSAYHANTLPVETWNTLLIYTAGGEAAHAVRADAATFTELGSAPRVARGSSGLIVAQGAELTVEPHMEGVTFSPASDTFIWRGGWHRSLFRFQAGAELAGTELPGWVDIYAGPMVPIARIDLTFAFIAPRPALATHRPAGRTVTSNPYDTVFISYSHHDREAFSQACDEYARFGINIYTDEHLEAGADYERELGRMIASARVFHLLWSPTSASSAECRKEWMAALLREPSERFIKPWFWKQPFIPPPPEFVQHHISFRYQRLRRRLLKPETWF